MQFSRRSRFAGIPGSQDDKADANQEKHGGASIDVNATELKQILKLARFNLLRSYRNRMAAAPGFLDSISPWTSRTNTPKPGQGKGEDSSTPRAPAKQRSIDHTISHRHRLSLRDYPEDCPKPNVRWFYAVDVRHFMHFTFHIN